MSNNHSHDVTLAAAQRLGSGNPTREDILRLQQALLAGQASLTLVDPSSRNTIPGGGDIQAVLILGGYRFSLAGEMLRRLLKKPENAPVLAPSPEPLSHSPGLPAGSRMLWLRNPDFTGREYELAKMAELLALPEVEGKPASTVGVLLCGAPGMGKTQLAVEFCFRYRHAFSAVFWLQAELDLMMETADCSSSSLAAQPSPERLQIHQKASTVISAWAKSEPVLVILDDARDIERVKQWMEKLPPNVRLVITSQEDEWGYLPGFTSFFLAPFTLPEARRLLDAIAPRLAELSPAGSPDSRQSLLEQMEGSPLGLDLAGRFLQAFQTLSVQDYQQELDTAGFLLARASQAEREQSFLPRRIPGMALALAAGWKLLHAEGVSPLPLQLLRICSWCAPNKPIPWDVLAEGLREFNGGNVVDSMHVYQTLGGLYRLGLLQSTLAGPVIHAMTADFIQYIERVTREGSSLHLVARAFARLVKTANESRNAERILPLREHLQGVAFAAEAAGLSQAGELWNSLGTHLWFINELSGAQTILERALMVTERTFGSDHPNLAAVLINLGKTLEAKATLPAAQVCFEQALRIWDQQPAADPFSIAEALLNLGRILLKAGKPAQAQAALERALNLYPQQEPTSPVRIAILQQLGEALEAQALFAEAQIHYTAGLSSCWEFYGSNSPETLAQIASLARVQTSQGNPAAAQETLYQALPVAERIYGINHAGFELILSHLARLLRMRGSMPSADWDWDALPPAEKLLQIEAAVSGAVSEKVLDRLNRLAENCRQRGSPLEALTYYERALVLARKLAGSRHSRTAEAHNNLGEMLFASGQFADAREHYQEALRISKSVYGEENPLCVLTNANLGEVLWASGDLVRARARLLQARLMYESLGLGDRVELAKIVTKLGTVLAAQDDLTGAQSCFIRSLQINERQSGSGHPSVAADLNNLGLLFFKAGKHADAQVCFERAMQIFQAAYGSEHDQVASVIHNLGEALLAQGDLHNARSLFERSLHIRQGRLPADHPRLLAARRRLEQVGLPQ